MFIAEVIFILIAHHPRLQPRAQAAIQLPLRLIVCKLHTPEERLSYPENRVWDIHLMRKPDYPHYEAFPVEAAMLGEVLVCRDLEYNNNKRLHDATLLKRRKKTLTALVSHRFIRPYWELRKKQALLDDAANIRVIRVHHQSTISRKLC